jgi:DNA-binding CsgD family transcriptional regulator
MRVAFASEVCAAIFFDAALDLHERALFGARDGALEEYWSHWRAQDSVFSAVAERGAPVYNMDLCGEHEWRRHVAYLEFGKRHGVYHYMASPIYGADGTILGVLNYVRGEGKRRFDGANLVLAGVLSGYVSATWARVRARCEPAGDVRASGLSFRELQVARLAAAGRSNPEIGARLGIARETVKQTLRRVYRKLGAAGRADMVAQLARQGLLDR